ncbi:unnamed protein product [Adineta steineri]|uniref:Uncharacterized protein n=1 Tax=Adineta steineri TaxID=433720 RepID=A0A814J5Y5_9BILA|nr:unnamed protein product [Adineta steineri]
MSDEEITTNNSMDIDIALDESSSSPVPASSTAILDIGIGDEHISGSDDEDLHERLTSKSSTPDSTTIPIPITKIPSTTRKHPLTKNKSSLVNYERDSDDDEHTDEEDEEDNNNEEQNDEDDQSNSNSAGILHGTGESDSIPMESTTYTEQTIVTSDLLNVTPFKPDDASPSSRNDLTSHYPLIFPEDAEIRIPPEPAKNCSAKLEKKFEEYYKRFKKTGVDQNVAIQELKDFRNPCMYEKMISHLDIDEIGTNFPQELYDPHWWGKESYYEELSMHVVIYFKINLIDKKVFLGKAQKIEMDRREKERRERPKIGFTPGVKKVDQLGVGSSNNSDISGEKRKTRFDQ